MLQLKLTRAIVRARYSELMTLAEHVEMARSSRGNRRALELLLNVIGTTPNPNRDEDYFGEALDYHLGHLYAHLYEFDKAATHLNRSNTHPHSGGDLLFSEQSAEALALHAKQLEAIARGLPAILIASMPRSASASLSQTIQATLGVPIMRPSLGSFPNYTLMPRWLMLFLRGGAVTHDHFGASPFNLKVLSDAGVGDLFVLARDPRAAAASALRLGERQGEFPLGARMFGEALVEMSVLHITPWVTDWLAAEEQVGNKLRFHWIASDEARSNVAETVQRIVSVFRHTHPTAASLAATKVEEVRANYVQGDDDAWRGSVDEEGRDRMWKAIPQRAREILQLER